MNAVITACGRCGSSVAGEMRFCPSCGKSLIGTPSRSYLWLSGIAALLCGSALLLQTTLQSPSLRVAKTGAMAPGHGAPGHGAPGHGDIQESNDPQIVAMRREVEAAPEDLTKLKVFAGMLGDKIRQEPGNSKGLVFEAIDVLGRILQLAPNDPGALVLMADVSFEQQAFSKALEFYERYLAIESDDLGARARYASTLTFLGRFDDSIAELNKVLAKDKKNFPAMAYLAITYHQKGDFKKARQHGTKALEMAPSEEARARFSGFMKSLEEAEKGAAVSVDSQATSGAAGVGTVAALADAVRSNPVAGPKFVRHEESSDNGSVKLYFREFPMQMMPPFAKEKFLSGIKSKVAELQLKKLKRIDFVDEATGATMETLSVG